MPTTNTLQPINIFLTLYKLAVEQDEKKLHEFLIDNQVAVSYLWRNKTVIEQLILNGEYKAALLLYEKFDASVYLIIKACAQTNLAAIIDKKQREADQQAQEIEELKFLQINMDDGNYHDNDGHDRSVDNSQLIQRIETLTKENQQLLSEIQTARTLNTLPYADRNLHCEYTFKGWIAAIQPNDRSMEEVLNQTYTELQKGMRGNVAFDETNKKLTSEIIRSYGYIKEFDMAQYHYFQVENPHSDLLESLARGYGYHGKIKEAFALREKIFLKGISTQGFEAGFVTGAAIAERTQLVDEFIAERPGFKIMCYWDAIFQYARNNRFDEVEKILNDNKDNSQFYYLLLNQAIEGAAYSGNYKSLEKLFSHQVSFGKMLLALKYVQPNQFLQLFIGINNKDIRKGLMNEFKSRYSFNSFANETNEIINRAMQSRSDRKIHFFPNKEYLETEQDNTQKETHTQNKKSKVKNDKNAAKTKAQVSKSYQEDKIVNELYVPPKPTVQPTTQVAVESQATEPELPQKRVKEIRAKKEDLKKKQIEELIQARKKNYERAMLEQAEQDKQTEKDQKTPKRVVITENKNKQDNKDENDTNLPQLSLAQHHGKTLIQIRELLKKNIYNTKLQRYAHFHMTRASIALLKDLNQLPSRPYTKLFEQILNTRHELAHSSAYFLNLSDESKLQDYVSLQPTSKLILLIKSHKQIQAGIDGEGHDVTVDFMENTLYAEQFKEGTIPNFNQTFETSDTLLQSMRNIVTNKLKNFHVEQSELLELPYFERDLLLTYLIEIGCSAQSLREDNDFCKEYFENDLYFDYNFETLRTLKAMSGIVFPPPELDTGKVLNEEILPYLRRLDKSDSDRVLKNILLQLSEAELLTLCIEVRNRCWHEDAIVNFATKFSPEIISHSLASAIAEELTKRKKLNLLNAAAAPFIPKNYANFSALLFTSSSEGTEQANPQFTSTADTFHERPC